MSPRCSVLTVVTLALALGTAVPAAAQDQPGNAPGNAPAGDRSMAFRPGLGDAARERVPGGRLLVLAYSAVLTLIGAYVVFVARKAARLDAEVRRLEDDLERRTGGR